ncbi:uncharacterized protein [Lepisosteus oculatus]|uniref:uncharacterized protein isoform X2 n=1 Tax=Lepisosteus oculatus TaxID=7918 RepID=UPI0035F51092
MACCVEPVPCRAAPLTKEAGLRGSLVSQHAPALLLFLLGRAVDGRAGCAGVVQIWRNREMKWRRGTQQLAFLWGERECNVPRYYSSAGCPLTGDAVLQPSRCSRGSGFDRKVWNGVCVRTGHEIHSLHCSEGVESVCALGMKFILCAALKQLRISSVHLGTRPVEKLGGSRDQRKQCGMESVCALGMKFILCAALKVWNGVCVRTGHEIHSLRCSEDVRHTKMKNLRCRR